MNLTEREQEIIRLLADDKTSHQIAAKLHLSTTAVNDLIARLCIKLGVASRRQLIDHARTREVGQ